MIGVFVFGFQISLCSALSIGGAEGLKRADLFESAEALAKAGEFPRAPAASIGRFRKPRTVRQGVR